LQIHGPICGRFSSQINSQCCTAFFHCLRQCWRLSLTCLPVNLTVFLTKQTRNLTQWDTCLCLKCILLAINHVTLTSCTPVEPLTYQLNNVASAFQGIHGVIMSCIHCWNVINRHNDVIQPATVTLKIISIISICASIEQQYYLRIVCWRSTFDKLCK
jgi:hypothetical protein